MSKVRDTGPSGWYGKKCGSLDEMRTEGIRFWQRQGGAAIRQAAWELVVENLEARHGDGNELRFQRSAPAVREA
jgi:hypothetical protein